MAKLNFTVAMNLLTDNFKQGANSVKAQVASMRKNILGMAAAFGIGGLGITKFVKGMFDAGIEMEKSKAQLKAATKTTEDYNSALGFCKKMADKYRMSVNELISSYSNYTATATAIGVSQKDQQTMYESLTRACKTHLRSQEETSGVIDAVSMAMRKGSVTSRQFSGVIGRAIPEASRVMADALGVNQEQLKKMFSSGKIGVQQLIMFTKQLNKEIKNPDVNTISGAFAALHNDMVKVAESTDVSGAFKKTLNGVVKIFDAIANNLTTVFDTIFAVLLGYGIKWAGKMMAPLLKPWIQMEATAQASTLQVEALQAKLAAKQAAYSRAVVAEKTAAAKLEEITNTGTATQKEACEAKMQLATEKRISAEKAMIAAEATYNKAAQESMVLANQAASIKSLNVFSRAFIGIKSMAISSLTAISTFMKTNWLFLIIAIVTEVAMSFKNIFDEEKAIKKKWQEYKNATSSNTGTTDEIVRLRNAQSIINDTKASLKEKNQALNDANNILGTNLKLTNNNLNACNLINKSIQKRIDMMLTEARLQSYINKVAEAYNNLTPDRQEIESAKKGNYITQSIDTINKYTLGLVIGGIKKASDFYIKQNIKAKMLQLKNDKEIIQDGEKNIKLLSKQVKNMYKKNRGDLISAEKRGSGKTGKDSETNSTNDAIDKYNQSVLEAKVKHDVEKTSVQEYNKTIDDLNSQTLEEIKASNNKRLAESEFAKEIQKRSENPQYDQAQDELDKVIADYAGNLNVLKNKLEKHVISEEDYDQGLIDLAKSAAITAASIRNVGTKADGFISQMGTTVVHALPAFNAGKRDTTFDYRNTQTDNMSADIEWEKELLKRIEEYKKEGGLITTEIQALINSTQKEIKDKTSKLTLAQVKEDVKALKKELNSTKFEKFQTLGEGVMNVAQSIGTINQAFGGQSKQLDAFINKINSLWQAFNNIYNVVKQVSEVFSTLTTVKKQLGEATRTEAAMEKVATDTKVISATKGAAAEVAASTVTQTTAHADVSANAADAASSQAKHAAKLPWPFGIIAAGVAIAAIMALFSKLSHFAGGGIVSGNSFSGDNVLARVNSGEMILNKSQQGRLFNILQNGNTGTGSNVNIQSTKVRGSDLYLTLKNYMKSTGHKF